MRFSSLMLLYAAIGVVFWLLGYQSAGLSAITTLGSGQLDIPTVIGSATSPTGILFIISVALGGLASLVLGFSAMYVIPAVILSFALSYFVLPLDVITGQLDPLISIPLFLLLNTYTMIAILDFIRGGA